MKPRPLVAKEIRLLLPAYIAALLLAVGPACLPSVGYGTGGSVTLGCFGLGLAFLAISSFGQEFSMKTFPLLLTQPAERTRVWRTKIGILAGAVGTVFLVWLACTAINRTQSVFGPDAAELLPLGGILALLAFSGGLCATLLVRQVTGAFWFTLFLPLALWTLLDAVGAQTWLEYVFFGAYSVAAFLFARRLFYQAQEVGWTGGTVIIGGWRMAGTARAAIRLRRPVAALLWKEIKLHQAAFLGAAGLFCLHLAAIGLRKFAIHALSDTLRSGLDVIGGLWLFVPLLVAATAVAEERKLGTMQTNLALPVSRRSQFLIKLSVALVIGGLLCPALLWALESVATTIGAYFHVGLFSVPFDRNLLVALCIVFLGWSLVCFYASSLTDGLVPALAASVVTGGLIYAISFFFGWLPYVAVIHFGFWLWQDPLLVTMGVPLLIIGLVLLSFQNFKTISADWKLWRRNLWTLAVSLFAFAVTLCITFNRAWELLTPLEPAHGPARIAGNTPPQMQDRSGFYQLQVLLPDGRLWVKPQPAQYSPFGQTPLKVVSPMFLPGSNWLAVFVGDARTIAISNDGALWVSAQPIPQPQSESGLVTTNVGPLSPLVQLSSDHVWKELAGIGWGRDRIALLREDGTLWWGSEQFIQERDAQKIYITNRWKISDRQIGTNAGWSHILTSPVGVLAWKDDGQAWNILFNSRDSSPQDSGPKFDLQRFPRFDRHPLRCYMPAWPVSVGIDFDGALWGWGMGLQQLTRIGTDTNWTSIAETQGELVACKADGTLWTWKFQYSGWPLAPGEGFITEQPVRWGSLSPVRLDTHHDWLAVAGNDEIIALAADGSLWHWPDRSPSAFAMRFGNVTLLPYPEKPDTINNDFAFMQTRFGSIKYGFDFIPAGFISPSRHPVCVGNIFDGADSKILTR